MAKEAIEAVREAEQEANRMLQDATQTSRDIKKEAERLAEEKYQQILEEANREAEEIKQKALQEGEAVAKPILEKGMKESERLIALSDEDLSQAVNIIIERIVNTYGNS